MAKHWSERLACGGCGMSFRSLAAESYHRHNYPLVCRAPKTRKPRPKKQPKETT